MKAVVLCVRTVATQSVDSAIVHVTHWD